MGHIGPRNLTPASFVTICVGCVHDKEDTPLHATAGTRYGERSITPTFRPGSDSFGDIGAVPIVMYFRPITVPATL